MKLDSLEVYAGLGSGQVKIIFSTRLELTQD